MFQYITKIIALALVLGLNMPGVLAVNEALAYFDDIENSNNNTIEISTLDFFLSSSTNFLPLVTPTQSAKRVISVINDGSLSFQYRVYANEFSGDTDFCNALRLRANLDGGEFEYIGPLTDFTYETGEFSELENWEFIASLPDDNSELENKTCNFKFIFEGVQLGPCKGFSDIEEIENTIISTQFGPYVVINKVYYDVDDEHGRDPKNEWVELYNPSSQAINLKNWDICDNDDCINISPNVSIPALGYALVAHDASTWKYWEIIDGVKTIHQLGGGYIEMNEVADMLILKNESNVIIDQMNWGIPDTGWTNYNFPYVWHPGVSSAPKGHMLGRVPNGSDTDTADDWKDLGLPEVTVLYPNGGEQWLIVPPHWASSGFGIYTIKWEALNPNGPDEDLKIDIWFCNNHGNNCFYKIVDDTDNDGEYEWTIPYDHRFVGADIKIKISAEGPENFMVQAWDKSDNDFCPPLLTESEVLEMMLLKMIEPSEEIPDEGIFDEEIVDEEILDEEMNDEEIVEEIIGDNQVPDTSIINDNTFVGISAPSIDDAADGIEDDSDADADPVDEDDAETPVDETSDEADAETPVGDAVNDNEVPDTSIINGNTFVGISAPSVEDAAVEVEDDNDDATREETPEAPETPDQVEPEPVPASEPAPAPEPEPVIEPEPEPVIEPEPVETLAPEQVEPTPDE